MIKTLTAFMLLIMLLPSAVFAQDDDWGSSWEDSYDNPFEGDRSRSESPFYEEKEKSEDRYKSERNSKPTTELSNDLQVKGSSSESVMRNLMTKKK